MVVEIKIIYQQKLRDFKRRVKDGSLRRSMIGRGEKEIYLLLMKTTIVKGSINII